MKKQLRLLTVLLLALFGGVNVWAEDVTDTWTASSGALGTETGSGTITTTGGRTWNYTRTLISGESYTGFSSGCIQLGKNGGVENLTLSTTAYGTNTIKKVSVECASYQAKHNVSIKVGNTDYLESTATSSWTTVSAAEGTGTSSGEIVISFTGGTRALYIKSITVIYDDPNIVPDDRTPVTLSFDPEECDATYGEEFTEPTLKVEPNENNITRDIIYMSSNESVATVDEVSGEVTLVNRGTTVITASFAGNPDYKPANASYTLHVYKESVVVDGFFDFEDKTLYYNTILRPSSSTGYITEDVEWEAGNVTLKTSGRYRWWEEDGTLRFYNNDPKSSMTLSVPSGYVITNISIAGGRSWTTDVEGYNSNTGKWEGQSRKVVFTYNASSGSINVRSITVTYMEFVPGTLQIDPELTYSATTANAEVGYEFDAPTLSCVEGFTGSEDIVFSSSDEGVATIDNLGLVSLVGAGTTVITASFPGDETYLASSASYTLTVTDPNAPGTVNNPYTVAQALEVIGELANNEYTDLVYVTGKISQIKEVNLTYGNATYYISDDGSTTSQLEVFRGYYLGNVKFESEDQIAVGDEVKIYGKLNNYYSSSLETNTFEIAKDNYIVALTHNTPQPAGYEYMTYCSTNNLDFTGKDLKAYIVTGYNDLTYNVKITRINQVPAQTGILIRSAEENLPSAFNETDYVTTETITADLENMLVGVIEPKTLTPTYSVGALEYVNYVLAKPKDKALGFYTISKSFTLGANKAYLPIMTTSVLSNELSFEIIDDTDAIQGVETKAANDGAWYTIQGVRVAQPTQSGIYIHNGVKVVVK